MFPSRWKLVAYAVTLAIGCLIALPNILSPQQLSYLPDWLPKKQVTLGLDLKGGSHLVLEIDAKTLRRERINDLADNARSLLRQAKIPNVRVGQTENAVLVRFGDQSRRAAIERTLREMVSTVELTAFSGPQPDLELKPMQEGLVLEPTEAALIAWRSNAVSQSLEIIRKRIDEVGVAEPTIQQMGPDRILVQLPGVQDPARIKALLGSTAKLTFHRVASSMDLAGLAPGQTPNGFISLAGTAANERYLVEAKPMLQGDRLVDANAGFEQNSGQPIVSFRFDTAGAKAFADITRDNVGQPFAIVLDGKVLSAPVIREPILGGAGQISGNFSVADTTSLSALLRAGALPVPLNVIEERIVGADLGADAIQMGAATGVAGFILVCAFMVGLYGRWGWVANLALLLNVILTFSGLTLLGATLTLPGIAGIVLGIGLAVDANVLINERIREETRAGKAAASALNAGFARAYATIVDSNVTALIATLLLFWFGSGPVRGFAVTMGLGIAISMFTAVTVVKVIMLTWLRWRRPKMFVINPLVGGDWTARVPTIAFMRARYFGIAMSLLLSVASICLFVQPGPNYGIDFLGGIMLEVKTAAPADLGRMRAGLETLGLGDVSLQEFGDDRTTLIRVERQAGDDAAQMTAVDRVKAAIVALEPESNLARVEVVGPKVSGELKTMGVLAVVLASLAMLVYIWVRFEWQFAVGAIATLVLDITKTVGFFALTGLDFGLTAIAALLTLIGYSVNDKVVVYDRMRENLRLYKAMPLRELIDLSINQTLARSLYTSATAFLAMLPMAIWGGPAVESFAVPMLFGIFIAASSSVFIAAPILLFLGENRIRRRAAPGLAAGAAS